jgi:Flp pilus assembly protein TadD
VAICGLIVLAVAVVFGQTAGHGFVNYDDDDYVYENPHVTPGLTGPGILWAFTQAHASNWHPLTWVSHMLDCELFGAWPAGHHLTSAVLHAVTAVLLFLVLRLMTGATWPSAFVAVVFAIHPLRAESVAWVAERKDVLSGLFFMLTLYAYAAYARRPFSLVRYLTVCIGMALGLMAKPMLVTLPFVLLLLDYWPLRRFGARRDGASRGATGLLAVQQRSAKALLLEKLPLFAIAFVSCVVTLQAQQGSMATVEGVPVLWRLANALVAYVSYLGQTCFPVNLSVLYPHPGDRLPLWQAGAAAAILAAVSVVAVAQRRQHPYLLVGWLWYVGMLVPVIGIVQVGRQAMADRYTYLPQIGVLIAISWYFANWCAARPLARGGVGVAAAAVIVAFLLGARAQVARWRNSETLWRHALACTSANFVAENNLGCTLLDNGRPTEAVAHFRQAIAVHPGYAPAHYNLGSFLAREGRLAEGMLHLEEALRRNPRDAKTHGNLGAALARAGHVEQAITHYRQALDLNSELAEVQNNFANLLADHGQVAEAIARYQAALRIKPDYLSAHFNLACTLMDNGRVQEAVPHLRTVLQLRPDFQPAADKLRAAGAARSHGSSP